MAGKPEQSLKPSTIEGLVALVLAAALAGFMARDLAWPLDRLAVDGKGNTHDSGQMSWNLWHVAESVLRFESPFQTNEIYYPLGTPLGKHTLVSGYLPLTLLVRLVMSADPEYPVYAFNVAILVSFTLLGFFSFLALRALGATLLAAAAFAVAFTYSDYFFLHYLHLNHMSAFFFPLCAWLAARLVARPSGALLLALAAAMGVMPYFTELAISAWLSTAVALLVFVAFPHSRRALGRLLLALGPRNLALAAAVFVLLALPLAMAYLSFPATAPRPSDFTKLSANLAGLVIPSPQTTPLYGEVFAAWSKRITLGLGGKEVFLGFPLLLLGLVGLRRLRHPLVAFLALNAALFFTLCVGPSLRVLDMDTQWTMPYAGLMKLPPFDQNRCPVRFAIVGLYCLSVLAALGLTWLTEILGRRGHRAAATVLGIAIITWVVAEALPPAQGKNRVHLEAPTALLQELPQGPIAVVPIGPKPCNQVLMQTVHGRPIANGCLARHTSETLKHVNRLSRAYEKDMPSFGRLLTELGFKSILVADPIPAEKLEQLRRLSLPVVVIPPKRLP